MADPTPRTRRGSHRGRPELARGAGASAVAVGAVALLIVALLAWQGRRATVDDGVQTGAPALAASTSASLRSAPPAPPTPTVTPDAGSASPTVTSSASAQPTPSAPSTQPPSTQPTPSVTASGTPTSNSPPSASPLAARLPVVILNQSSRKGLAARTAALLRGGGWRVASVGNAHGAVPSTTVYAPAGAEDQAAAVAALLPGADRVRPVTGSMSTSRLTVVLTSSYPG